MSKNQQLQTILTKEEAIEQLKEIVAGIYLTGYDQGYHETHDDKDLKAFEVFWSSANPNTWKERFEAVWSAAEQATAKRCFEIVNVQAESSNRSCDCSHRSSKYCGHTSLYTAMLDIENEYLSGQPVGEEKGGCLKCQMRRCICFNEEFSLSDPCMSCANGEHDDHCQKGT